jgi:hypothetical protein
VSQVLNKLLTKVTESDAEKEENWGSHGKEEESDTLFFFCRELHLILDKET